MDLVVDDGAEPIQQQRKKQGEAISRIEEEKLGIRDLRFGINVTQRREATVEHGIGKRGKPRGPPPSAMQSESVVGIGDSRTLRSNTGEGSELTYFPDAAAIDDG
ncbi:hypothetical protein DY000_02050058 [Brassica cretica]|uniref:Uncharacterized protein n=1 Tax=Brassica cretica TaxID=69181 RepID=A0ABQ7EWC1_BRACR|nr:hypothetical protein DY000_02050058 [Brassica cretica]